MHMHYHPGQKILNIGQHVPGLTTIYIFFYKKIPQAQYTAAITHYTTKQWRPVESGPLQKCVMISNSWMLLTVYGKMFEGEKFCGFPLNRKCFPTNYGLVDGNVSLQPCYHATMLPWKFSHEWKFCTLTAKVFPHESSSAHL